MLFFKSSNSQDTTLVLTDAVPVVVQSKWIYVSMSIDGQQWYIYNNYVSKQSNGEIKIWIKIKSLDPVIIKKKSYKNTYELMLGIFDCSNKRYKLISSTTYSKERIVIKSIPTDYDTPYDDIYPESVIELVIEKICNKFNL